jgi:hypothetical protein
MLQKKTKFLREKKHETSKKNMVSFNLLEQFVLVKSYEIHQLLLNSSLSVSEKIHPPSSRYPSPGPVPPWAQRKVEGCAA